VALAAADQPLVDGCGDQERDGEGEGQRAPEQSVRQVGLHRAGDEEQHAVVDDLHDGDGQGVGGQRDSDRRLQAEARPGDGPEGQGVAEEERQRDGQHHGRGVVPAEGGADDHAEHLPDGAAGEAVQRRLHGHAPPHRALPVVGVAVGSGVRLFRHPVVVLVVMRVLIVGVVIGAVLHGDPLRSWTVVLVYLDYTPWGYMTPRFFTVFARRPFTPTP
jgi:hypothetical protein